MKKIILLLLLVLPFNSIVNAEYIDDKQVHEDGYLYIKKISKNKVSYYLKVNEFQGCESNGMCNTASPNFKVVERTVKLYNSKYASVFKGKKQGDRLIVIGKKVYNKKGIYSGFSYSKLYKIEDYVDNIMPYEKLENYKKWTHEIGEQYDGNGTTEMNDIKIVNNGIKILEGDEVYELTFDFSNRSEVNINNLWYHWTVYNLNEYNEDGWMKPIEAIKTDDVNLSKIYVRKDSIQKSITLNVGGGQAYPKIVSINITE